MEEYEIVERVEQSILKNIQELAEYIYYDLGITNYYDFIDKIEELRKRG